MPASQAGRRGFESRLPLHLSNNLEDSTSSYFTSFTSKTRLARRRSSLRWLAVGQCQFEFSNGFPSAFKIALGIRIDSDPDRMPTLIGGHLRVDALIMAETRLRSAQYLKVHPPESDLVELLLNVPAEKFIEGTDQALLELLEHHPLLPEAGVEIERLSCRPMASLPEAAQTGVASSVASIQPSSSSEDAVETDEEEELDDFQSELYLCPLAERRFLDSKGG